MPTPRVGLAAATLGRVHTFGGKDASTQKVVPTHEVYDPATGAWSPARDMPTARSGLAAVATPGGLIYALGGFDGQGNILATVEIYDPSTNNWRTSKPMPTPRANLAAVFFGPDQNIYAIGGRNNNGVLDTVEIFNPTVWVATERTARCEIATRAATRRFYRQNIGCGDGGLLPATHQQI